ncbi:hypothetical protein [Streptomyces odontomachi]|uniref:hypothetical protein n=1 Tax=Streptomyces odontomachi TaxID=2944940 RepID=UPI00210E445A|nr:hypothetical protein [Streptomyces sp. ODS25]
MPDSVSDPTNLKAQYAAQVATDLENNAKEQERIGSDIAALQRQLEELERDHALLLSMQQALATEPPVAPDAPAGDGPVSKARLPRARRPKDASPERGGRPTKSARRAPESRQVKGAATARPARGRGARGRAGGPTLREVVSQLLSGHHEPRSAAEVTSALAQSHPERKVSPTVVRNTLEALVAKGQAHRSKQQNSVFYTATEATPVGPEGDTDRGTGEQAGAPGEASGA